jgi:3-oxoadipate enol-lactonase
MSIGGAIALDFALTYPDMVGALVLIAAGIGGYPQGETTLALAAPLIEAFKAGDFVRAIDLSVRLWVDGPKRAPEQVDPVVRERVRKMYTEVLRRSREGARSRTPSIHPPTRA